MGSYHVRNYTRCACITSKLVWDVLMYFCKIRAGSSLLLNEKMMAQFCRLSFTYAQRDKEKLCQQGSTYINLIESSMLFAFLAKQTSGFDLRFVWLLQRTVFQSHPHLHHLLDPLYLLQPNRQCRTLQIHEMKQEQELKAATCEMRLLCHSVNCQWI